MQHGTVARSARPPSAPAIGRRPDISDTCVLPSGGQAEAIGARQEVEVRKRKLGAQEIIPPVSQLALDDLQADFDLGKRVRHHLLVRRNAKLGKHAPLVRHVIDHVGVVVGIDRADPLVHARALPRARRPERRLVECLFDIGYDGARFIDREIAMLEDRHAVEGMQCEVSWFAHLRFEIPEGVGDLFMREHQPHDLNKSAAWKPEYDRVSH